MSVINDEEFGQITVRRNHKASQIRIRVDAGGKLYASMPTYAPLFLVKHLVKNSRGELRKLVHASRPKYEYYDGMSIGKSHTLHIRTECSSFSIARYGQRIVVDLNSIDDLSRPENDRQLRNMIASATRIEAKSYLPRRLSFLANKYNFNYERVRFSHASGRWGSCSSNGTISLNIAIMNLPFELIDYILIHELSHTREMNHSTNFWAIVATVDPDYKTKMIKLKKYNPSI